MKIGILGATGAFGKGLTFRWAGHHTILIGSRSPDKARATAAAYRAELSRRGSPVELVGLGNRETAEQSDIVVLSLKFEHLSPVLDECREALAGKTVLSPVVALARGTCFRYTPPPEGSVAMHVQGHLPEADVVAALHTIPAHRLRRAEVPISGDVPLCGNRAEPKERVAELIRRIENLRPVDAGPLEAAALIEPIVPLILNLKQFGGQKDTSIHFM
jgi:NADPH-dependent F420 reductase